MLKSYLLINYHQIRFILEIQKALIIINIQLINRYFEGNYKVENNLIKISKKNILQYIK